MLAVAAGFQNLRDLMATRRRTHLLPFLAATETALLHKTGNSRCLIAILAHTRDVVVAPFRLELLLLGDMREPGAYACKCGSGGGQNSGSRGKHKQQQQVHNVSSTSASTPTSSATTHQTPLTALTTRKVVRSPF